MQQSNSAISIDQDFSIEMNIYLPSNAAYAVARFAGACRDEEYFDAALAIKSHVRNADNLCMARAVVLARATVDLEHAKLNDDAAVDRFTKAVRNMKRSPQTWERAAEHLLNECGIPLNKPSYAAADLIVISAQPRDYHVSLYTRPPGQRWYSLALQQNPNAQKKLNIAFHKDHYDFFKPGKNTVNRTFCRLCFETYARAINHRCKHVCSKCRKPNCTGETTRRVCEDCGVSFETQKCYDNHKLVTSRSPRAICDKFKVCPKAGCNKYYSLNNLGSRSHVCGETNWCCNCRRHVKPRGHNCCWAPPTDKEKQKKREKQQKFQLIIYDFETVVVENPDVIDDWAEEQYPNMVCYAKMCEKCANLPADRPCEKCVVKKGCIKYESVNDGKWSVVDRFLDYILTDPSCNNAILMAHNGSRFDSHFFLRRLFAREIYPEVVPNGNQIMLMTVTPLKGETFNTLTFKDSYLLMPLPLASLPEAFGLPNLAKGEFPYLYNMPAHYGTVLAELPAPEYYCPRSKNAKRRAEFEEWYEEHKAHAFDSDLELQTYCEMDVAILRDAVAGYMFTSIELTTWYPVVHCCTYASFSMFQLKMQYLREDHVGILPENGVMANEQQSVIALKYIQWLEENNGIELKYTLRGGEYQVHAEGKRLRVDAYHAETNTIYEILGCFYHGCKECAHADDPNPLYSKTYGQVYDETQSRIAVLEREGYTVVQVWEHEIAKELLGNVTMREYFKECVHLERLIPRDASMGGRTQTYQLLAEPDRSKGQTIEYLDFCSLYPYVTSSVASYPIGYPEIITSDFKPFVPGQPSPYRGLIKCDVLPPRNLRYPIIGMRHNEKLVYANCRTCAESGTDELLSKFFEEASSLPTLFLPGPDFIDLQYFVPMLKCQGELHVADSHVKCPL